MFHLIAKMFHLIILSYIRFLRSELESSQNKSQQDLLGSYDGHTPLHRKRRSLRRALRCRSVVYAAINNAI